MSSLVVIKNKNNCKNVFFSDKILTLNQTKVPILLKFRFSEKATKFETKFPLVLTLLGKNSGFVKPVG